MDVITIKAEPRVAGKSGARAARRDGKVPCVLYGHHVKENVVFQVPEATLMPLIYTSEQHLVRIELNGDAWDCILKDLDFHPVTDRPMHADFQVLQTGEKVTLSVPVRYHGTPIGQTEGGNTSFAVHELTIRCLPKDIPSYIDVDVSQLGIGDSIHVSDLDYEGIEFMAQGRQTLVTVVPPRGLTAEEKEAEAEELEGITPEEGAAEAPAEEEETE